MPATLNQDTIASLKDLGEEFFSDLVGTFLGSAREEIERIRRASAAGDAKDLGKAAHRLKGACLTQGAEEMAVLCREIERRGAESGLAGIGDLPNRLEEAFRRTRQSLARLLPPE